MDIYSSLEKKKQKKSRITFFGFFLVVAMFAGFFFLQLISTPVLVDEKTVTIPDGYSIIQTASLLEDEGIINSELFLRLYMQYKKISPKSGSYHFVESGNIFYVAERLESADYGDVYVNVTIPEGSTNEQLISAATKSDLDIDTEKMRTLILDKEGYLFPDTYSFLPDADEEDLVKKLEETFLKKIEEVEESTTISKTREEMVIMASLLEKEAGNNLEQKQIISGILWKRISIGMPLQVDAPFLYERGKGSAKLSTADLRKDSIYNTYVNKGLTPTAIGNPGYDSLYAAAHPIESEYLFYLHGSDGKVYYGKNHNQHLKNKRMYIR